MQKLLCPYCDHEIKGKGKCDFCGSKVKKPVVAETSAEFSGQDLTNPDGRDYSVNAQGGAGAMDTGAAAGAAAPSRAANAVTGMPRRAVLASEAVEAGKATGTMKSSATSQKVVKVIVIVVIVNIILQIIFSIANLL